MDPANPSDDGGDTAPNDTSGVFIDMHSNAALILWPWGDTFTDSPNVTALTTLGRRIAYFNGYTPEQSNELYFTDGTTDDSMYGLLGVAAFTIETNGFDFFEDCATFEANTAPTNLDALRYTARTLHAPYQLPLGPDTIQVTASPDLVIAGDALNLQANLDSSRFNNSNGTQPVHNIASALAYLDALPWDGTDPGTALQASDGAFDSAVEVGVGTISTTGLSSGRHFVYVQATDVNSNAGTPNAAFFDVGAADEITTLDGRVSDLATGDAVAATVALNNPDNGETRQTTSDASSGDYTAHTFAGTFNVTVSAPRYLAQAVQGIALAGGGTVTQDFALLHDCEIFSDDVENGGSLWTAQSPWVIASNVPGDTTHVWNTPNYGDNIEPLADDGNLVRPHRLQRRHARFRRPLRHRIRFRLRLRRIQHERIDLEQRLFVHGPDELADAPSESARRCERRGDAEGPFPSAKRQLPERAGLGARQYPPRSRRRRLHRRADHRPNFRRRIRSVIQRRKGGFRPSPVRMQAIRRSRAYACACPRRSFSPAKRAFSRRCARVAFLRARTRSIDADAALAFLAGIGERDATHNCWAYRIGTLYRFNDDGEPAGTAGKPILQAIDATGRRRRGRGRDPLVRRHQARRRRPRARLWRLRSRMPPARLEAAARSRCVIVCVRCDFAAAAALHAWLPIMPRSSGTSASSRTASSSNSSCRRSR